MAHLVLLAAILLCLINANSLQLARTSILWKKKLQHVHYVASLDPTAAGLPLDSNQQLMLDALRGKNINNDDVQRSGVDMMVVQVDDDGDALPLIYNAAALDRYFDRRPGAVLTRVWQIFRASASLIGGILADYATGRTEDIDIRRAAQLRETLVSLGPFFIKGGQALSIRPDILPPRAMIELQQLCDKVPCFDSALAMQTIEQELGKAPQEVFDFASYPPEPVAAASLGQVYKAKVKGTNEEVAIKVQRPYVLETVSLDLYLFRKVGGVLSRPPFSSSPLFSRLDPLALLDEFADKIFQELDYNVECQNGLRVAKEMQERNLGGKVVTPIPLPSLTTRRLHVAQWIDGEKLSQSTSKDVSSLVNLGLLVYLSMLLESGFFHADPHPGNLLRTPDGKLCLLDFGLMTYITPEQRIGMIEAIAHLIHRDYALIGDDFKSLGFIPEEVDTAPLVPVLSRVFEAALAGGGARSLNFQELAGDLAEITFKYPFKIPPYFALLIRAISVLEGIALVGNPEFAIVDEAYPYIAKKLLNDQTDRGKQALRYLLCGRKDSIDVDRLLELLQAIEKFVGVRDKGDGTAFKVAGMRGSVYVGKAGESKGTVALNAAISPASSLISNLGASDATLSSMPSAEKSELRSAFQFFFSKEGDSLRTLLLDEVERGADALSRDAVRSLLNQFSPFRSSPRVIFTPFPVILPSKATVDKMIPPLSPEDKERVTGLTRLVNFFLSPPSADPASSSTQLAPLLKTSLASLSSPDTTRLLGTLTEFAPSLQDFGSKLLKRLVNRGSSRVVAATLDAIFGPE
eukprot:gene31574-38160_t